jgi:hypothetical protein
MLLFIWRGTWVRTGNGFEAHKIKYEGAEGHWMGWALEIETFLGPEKFLSYHVVGLINPSYVNYVRNSSSCW